MPIFENKKQHSIFFVFCFFSLLFFAVLFFVLPKANAEVLFSQPEIDSSITNSDLPAAINDPFGGMYAFMGEYGAFSPTATTTIRKISIYMQWQPDTPYGRCVPLHIEDVQNPVASSTNFLNQTANENGYCPATTTPEVISYTGTLEVYPQHYYTIDLDLFYNATLNTWYGTNIGSSTYPNLNWAGYAKDLGNGYYPPFSNQAIPLNPDYPMLRFSYGVMTSENDIWQPYFQTPPEVACESWNFGSLGVGLEICKALSFLFLPDSQHLQKFAQLGDTLANKPPFGYFNSVKSNLANLNTSSTPAFTFADMGDIKTQIFDPLRTGLAWILWILFAIWVIKRVGVFDF